MGRAGRKSTAELTLPHILYPTAMGNSVTGSTGIFGVLSQGSNPCSPAIDTTGAVVYSTTCRYSTFGEC